MYILFDERMWNIAAMDLVIIGTDQCVELNALFQRR